MIRALRWLTHTPIVRPLPGLRTSDYQALRDTDTTKAAEADARIADLRARLAALEIDALRDAHEPPHDHDT